VVSVPVGFGKNHGFGFKNRNSPTDDIGTHVSASSPNIYGTYESADDDT